MNRILVLGADGQLGSCLQDLIQEKGIKHWIFANRSTIDLNDLSGLEDYLKSNYIKVIINCAAYTDVRKAELEPEICDLINHKAVGHIAEICAKNNIGLVHISTDYVFSGKKSSPYKVDDHAGSKLVYGRSKLNGERAIQLAMESNYMIIRTSWLYSKYGRNFVKTMRDKLLPSKHSDVFEVVEDQVGRLTYAPDLAYFIYSIVEHNQLSLPAGIYHFANTGIVSWFDVARVISEIVTGGRIIKPILTPSDELPRPKYSVLDLTSIREYNWQPAYWYDSLSKCLSELNDDTTTITTEESDE